MQKKHRWDYYVKTYDVESLRGELPIVREPAVRGARHVVSEDDLRAFITLVPTWKKLSLGLRVLVLGEGDDECYGWHGDGVICLHAWSRELVQEWHTEFFDEHRSILDRLMVPYEPVDGGMSCRFDAKNARAFMLMHVFLHELGHHHDRMQTKKQTHSPRGEKFAETFGNSLADSMWDAYFRAFRH